MKTSGKNITVEDLFNGLELTTTPVIEGDSEYIEIKVKNAPYFLLNTYVYKGSLDDDTAMKMTCINLQKEVYSKFSGVYFKLEPEYFGWSNTNIDKDSVHYDEKGILRVSFTLIGCEL